MKELGWQLVGEIWHFLCRCQRDRVITIVGAVTAPILLSHACTSVSVCWKQFFFQFENAFEPARLCFASTKGNPSLKVHVNWVRLFIDSARLRVGGFLRILRQKQSRRLSTFVTILSQTEKNCLFFFESNFVLRKILSFVFSLGCDYLLKTFSFVWKRMPSSWWPKNGELHFTISLSSFSLPPPSKFNWFIAQSMTEIERGSAKVVHIRRIYIVLCIRYGEI